ncbi:MAG: DUF177 domain-containing protein [Devosiaceae bacterium]|nr:DUF177 domain-containing protein [Devosiaceae bacterium MH13]
MRAQTPDAALPVWTVRADELRSPARKTLELAPDQLAALAERFGLEAVESFRARLEATRGAKGAINIAGTVEASITYRCGVTLQTFPASISEEFSQRFVPEPSEGRAAKAEAVDIDPLADDEPDHLDANGAANGAELAYQHFAMALEPYPRHPDALEASGDHTEDDGADDAEPGNASPFAALEQLKSTLKS